MSKSLDPLFKPKSVALIGASTKELSIGNVIIKNLIRYKYQGPIYPIHPKVDEIRGLKAYKSILEVPGEVDLVHLVIPPQFVPGEVENCGKKGVKAIIINTAGFKEMGADGQELEDDFLARAKKYGIRIFGPNCQGIINSEIRAYCNFTFTFFEPGHVSIVAQSGGVGAVIMQAIHDMGIGIRMYASNGNASDISIPEIIRYYGQDENTRAIVIYVESVANPQEFLKIAKEVSAKKPILAMTAGRTDKGAEASRSHIGGLAGSISLEYLFKKANIISFTNQADLCNAAAAFSSQPIPKGNRVGIITNTGGPAVIAIDELVSNSLVVPPLSANATKILKTTMFESASVHNPLDVVATAGAAQFKSALEVMMNEPTFDSIFINFVTPPFVDCESVAKEIVEINKKQIKPMVCNYITDKQNWQPTTKILKDGAVPCFDFSETAAKALSSLVRYKEIKSKKLGKIASFDDVDKAKVKKIIADAKTKKQEVLTAGQAYEILAAYKIPAATWKIAQNSMEAIEIAHQIGFPVVIKADSQKIIHKSDVGGVAANINNATEITKIIAEMQKNLYQNDLKFLIQKQMPKATELIIGAKKESGLGHLIMFGLGGIFVEIFKDVAFNLTPITDAESDEMMDSLKSSPLIKGYRGEKGICKEQVSQVIQRVSALVCDFPEIKELDINPIFGYQDFVCAVDARIII
ncbi:MAG: CoA-binding protein [Bacteroidetes bacterium CG2_30_33_31]|nr:MAG: CoA-binding protein [Bacteroidetes bacterium CG2_30_33_31]